MTEPTETTVHAIDLEGSTHHLSRRYTVITAVDIPTLIQRVNDARDTWRGVPVGGIAFDFTGNPCQAMIL